MRRMWKRRRKVGGNQFHYTLITTYSSGRHLCTDPLLAKSAAQDLSFPRCVFICVCAPMNIHVHEAKPKLKDKIRIMKKMKSSGAFQVTNFMYKNNK